MLIKRMMLVAILATVTNATFGLDMGFVNTAAGEYGPQNNAITEAALNKVLEECRKVTDWNDVGQLPLSSILRAQLSNDTTSAQLGNSEAFRRLFPVNGAEIAAEFKKLVAADSTQASRNAAIDKIAELKAAAPSEIRELQAKFLSAGIDLSDPAGLRNSIITPGISADDIKQAIEFGLANVKNVGDNNQNALHWAMAFDKPEVMNVLLKYSGKDDLDVALNTADVNGRTPASFVGVHDAEGRHAASVRLKNILTDNGIDV